MARPEYLIAVKIAGSLHRSWNGYASEADAFGKALAKLPGVEGVRVCDEWGERPDRFTFGERGGSVTHPATLLLEQHRVALANVVATCSDTWTVNAARRYLAKVEWALKLPVLDGPFGTLGMFGDAGYGPAIADVVDRAERLAGERRAA